jgi:hypothetical protein
MHGGTGGGGRGSSGDYVGVSLRGWPGRRVAAGVGSVACGAPAGVAAATMAVSTRRRHRTQLQDPGGRPLGLGLLMLKVGVR